MKEFLIGKNDADQRLDKFVLKATSGLPHSLLYKAIRTKKIKVNRKRAEIGQMLREGDRVQLFLAPDFFGEKETRFLTLKARPEVVYEDENLLIAAKPAGLSCHADAVQETGTLLDQIKGYLAEKGEYRPQEEASFAPALCNRIDRNTQGLVIAAKNAAALREVSRLIREHRVEKEYLAWCHGAFEQEGVFTVYLKKNEAENRVAVSPTPQAGYRTAVTEICPLGQKGDRTLLAIRLHTGRTHQIRATLAYLDHPLVGDAKYGRQRAEDFAHQALLSHALTFHPEESSPLFYLAKKRFEAPPDPRFSL